MRRALARAGRVVRDGWLVLGTSLIVLMGLEGAYRLQAAARGVLWPVRYSRQEDRADFPYRGASWWEPFLKLRNTRVIGGNVVFDPYRAWWGRRLDSPLLGVDSLGRRRTIQHALAPGPAHRTVLMLGGSTMWGYTVRDSSTIPSLVSARLAALGYQDLEIVNLAQGGYNATQALITLVLELRAGRVPAAAVFLDGVNEIGPGFEGEQPGDVYAERRLSGEFESEAPSFGRRLLWYIQRHLLFVERLSEVVRPIKPAQQVQLSPGQCHAAAAYYLGVAQQASALGRTFGFPVLMIWQPTLALTHKTLSSWERYQISLVPLGRVQKACAPALDSLITTARPPVPVLRLQGVFDRDTGTVFFDDWGHVVERASPRLADTISAALAPLLTRGRR